MAKETLAGDLTKKYKVWLDKAVQDSGLEMLGQLGREYIDGTFAVSAKKNKDVKLKKVIRWLNQAIESGDGWAAFTKGNICYYGYGRWGERRQEAYNNYKKAANSKESIYALEYGEMCLRNGDLRKEVVDTLVEVLNE
jgi:TPR repeat protein